MATHSSILGWRIPMDRGAWWAAVYGVSKTEQLSTAQFPDEEENGGHICVVHLLGIVLRGRGLGPFSFCSVPCCLE